MGVWNSITYKDITPDRCDAEYHKKEYKDNIEKICLTGSVSCLGKLFRYINRGTQPLYSFRGNVKVLRSVNVGFMSFNDIRQEYVTEAFYEESLRGKVQKDDILITSTGVGTLGRTSIWYEDSKAFCDGHITILRGGSIDPYFVTVFLNTSYGIKQFNQNFRGSSGQIEIYPYDLSKFIIPNFLLDYQQEIGDYLRQSFQLQKKSQILYQQALDLLNKKLGLDNRMFEKTKGYVTKFSEVVTSQRIDSNHFRSDYDALFDFIKTNFEYKSIHQVVSVNRRGLQPLYVADGEINVVNSKHISHTHLKYDLFEKTSVEEYNRQKKVAQIQYGDVLVYTTGAYIGLTNVYLSTELALASNHVNILRLQDSVIDSAYLALVLNSPIGKLQTEKYARGSAQLELYPSDIARFIIPIISEKSMLDIGNKVRESLAILRNSKMLLSQAKQRVEQLMEIAIKSSIVRKR